MTLKIEKYPFVSDMINYQGQYCSLDTPGKSVRHIDDFYSYPIQDYDYKFNSWGFRGEDFEQYLGKKVNVCLGDSATLNLGGPVEHSWCGLLSENFTIPTLNFGMAAAGNDALYKVYESVVKLFDVQQFFVMYTFFHRRLSNVEFGINYYADDSENFEYFLQQRIPGSIECGLPWWFYTHSEREFLQQQQIFFVDLRPKFSDFENIDRKQFVDKVIYNKLRGDDWPTYNQFIDGAPPHEDMYLKGYNDFTSDCMFTNRDGVHINKQTNKLYADYLYQQWRNNYES